MRVAVVGHVEWVELARVEHVPTPGEIVHALDTWEDAAGGGAVAAVQLARLAGECLFLTALGDDELGRRAKRRLEELGVRVSAAWRPVAQRRAFVHVDSAAERTITVMGDRLGPHADDPLPWSELEDVDAVYFTAGDPGAVRASRAAGKLVATVRAIEAVAPAGVQLDVLVASAEDEGERYAPGDIEPPPELVVRTAGADGGSIEAADGSRSEWAAAPPPGPPVDAYGGGLLRRRPHLRPLRGPLTPGRCGPRSALRRNVRHGARALRGPARGGGVTPHRPGTEPRLTSCGDWARVHGRWTDSAQGSQPDGSGTAKGETDEETH